MTIFDIMGPVMVGPSSSHTAGAVRIGAMARRLLGTPPATAEISLHGSFAATGAGHGTDRALVAGLLGLGPDDPRIAHAFALAEQTGLHVDFGAVHLRGAHPNTVVIKLTGGDGRALELNASSLGGGRIRVNTVDGMDASFTGDYPTLLIRNEDRPGQVAEVSRVLSAHGVNIATMQLYRDRRGGLAVMVIESDQSIPSDVAGALRGQDGIVQVICIEGG